MYKSALAGLSLLTVLAIIQTSPKASALELSELTNINIAAIEPEVVEPAPVTVETAPVVTEVVEEKPEEITYTVAKNDSLIKIAKKFDTSWNRIFDKNSQIENPDVIEVGKLLVIPNDDEKLESRKVAEAEIAKPKATPVKQNAQIRTASSNLVTISAPRTYARGSSSGNLYVPGYCTWYVKNMRPDLPNNLGNADTWVIRARAQGIPTGTKPRSGAVGQRGMHVVYVKSVNRDGSVNISEMNHKGLWVITHRTLPGNYFNYIY